MHNCRIRHDSFNSMLRPKRRATPTVFIDDGTIPEDASVDEKSISNEEDLLKLSEDDVYGEDTPSEDDTPKKSVSKNTSKPVKKAESIVEVKNSPPQKSRQPVKKDESVQKKTRTFKLLTDTITPQENTAKINVKKIKVIEYETVTPIQAARKMGPTIHAAKIGSTLSTIYVFDVQEMVDGEGQKTFSYICESTIASGSVSHVIKPKTKKTAKSASIVVSFPAAKEKVVVKNYPIIPKKEVPARTNVKQLAREKIVKTDKTGNTSKNPTTEKKPIKKTVK